MSFPDAIAFCALMVTIISIAGMLLERHNRRLKNREKELELKVRLVEAEGKRGGGEVKAIEDRLRVLERIATDQPGRLSAEIERLRDTCEKENHI